ncbi:MAG: di-trans,poly-cis-decaprenylcistransferase [Candidatus Vogelbacteria bacterium]|nr:di-trans,poly-cis-decaprenylcistransferase [Candidatus Vogelbacteria bacterium]
MESNDSGAGARPKKIGIILDGNRRFAMRAGKKAFEGHKAGYLKFKEFLAWAVDEHIETVAAYAFSTENWKRIPEEVEYLLNLFRSLLERELQELVEKNVRLICAGDVRRFPDDLRELIVGAEERTKHCTKLTLYLAISYGGHAEILDACRRAVEAGKAPESEKEFLDMLWVPMEPDLIIRTGGDERLSNFLSWQSAYSEFFFTPTLWPDFTREEFQQILGAYERRQRRFGV